MGGIPEGEKYDFHSVLEELIARGKTIVLSTQAIYEGSDISVYRSGHVAKEEFGIMESYDMTMEATVTKLMWILGQTSNTQEIRRLFNTTIAMICWRKNGIGRKYDQAGIRSGKSKR